MKVFTSPAAKQPPPSLPFKRATEKGPEDVPILTYGTASNIVEFRKQLSIKAQLEYGELGRMIDTLVYPTFAPVSYNPNDLTPTADPHGLIKKVVGQKIVNVEKDIYSRNEEE